MGASRLGTVPAGVQPVGARLAGGQPVGGQPVGVAITGGTKLRFAWQVASRHARAQHLHRPSDCPQCTQTVCDTCLLNIWHYGSCTLPTTELVPITYRRKTL